MTRWKDLTSAVDQTLVLIEPLVQAMSKLNWAAGPDFTPLIRVACPRRQYDCLIVGSELAARNLAYTVVSSLRPACEELIWLKYLTGLSQDDQSDLLRHMTQPELIASLEAQQKDGGHQAFRALGLEKYLARLGPVKKPSKAALQQLGSKLGWEAKTVSDSRLPSMRYLAKQVGELKTYDLLYHATSRTVQFSAHELLRRAWGKSGDITIDSRHFADYWTLFYLYWGTILLAETICAASAPDLPDAEFDMEGLLKAANIVGSYGPVPIITAEELDWA